MKNSLESPTDKESIIERIRTFYDNWSFLIKLIITILVFVILILISPKPLFWPSVFWSLVLFALIPLTIWIIGAFFMFIRGFLVFLE